MDKQKVLAAIAPELDRMHNYGQLQIFVKMHRDEFSNIDFLHITSEKFDPQSSTEPNVAAATNMYQMLKGASISAKQTGKDTTLGFSIVLDSKGNAKTMQVQDFRKQ